MYRAEDPGGIGLRQDSYKAEDTVIVVCSTYGVKYRTERG